MSGGVNEERGGKTGTLMVSVMMDRSRNEGARDAMYVL